MADSDPLAARARVPVKALDGRPLIALPRGTGLRAAVDAGCAAAGFAPRIAFEAGNPEVLASLAARGLGVAVLPASLAEAYPGLRPVHLTQPALRSRLALAWREGGPVSPAARAFTRHAREFLAAKAASSASAGVRPVATPGTAPLPLPSTGMPPVAESTG